MPDLRFHVFTLRILGDVSRLTPLAIDQQIGLAEVHPQGSRPRAAYLGAIYDALVPGGCLVLTEKTRQDAATRSMYHAWKMHPRGVSAQKVLEKCQSLVGILKPLPVQWWVSLPYISRFHA